MHMRQLTDKTEILGFLETDRLYAAYAIGDLEPGLFAQSEWVGAEQAGQLRALALLYKGFDPPFLFLMGQPAGLARPGCARARAPTVATHPSRTDGASQRGSSRRARARGPRP